MKPLCCKNCARIDEERRLFCLTPSCECHQVKEDTEWDARARAKEKPFDK